MLRTMRESMKYLQWILYVIVAVFILFVFVDFGGFTPGGQGQLSRNAATVGNHDVSLQDFQREYQRIESQLREQLGPNYDPAVFGERIPTQAIERLVTQRILVAEAQDLGLTIPDEEVRAAIREIPGMVDENGRFIGREAYSQWLRSIGYTPEQFETALREDLMVQRLNAAIRSGIYVSAAEIERVDRERGERVNLRFVELPWGEVGPVEVDEPALQAYFATRREDYRLPERRVVDFLVVEQAKIVESITPTPEELRGYYDSHLEDFTQLEQVHARHILINTSASRDAAAAQALANSAKARIAAGEDFAALALELSDDVSNRDRGGDLGFFGRGRMVPAFEEAVFAATVGQVIGPIQTQFGFHLVEVLEKREERLRPFEEVATQITRRVQTDKASATALERATALRERIRAEKITTKEGLVALATQDPALTVDTSQPFGREDAIPSLGRAPELLQAAFELAADGVSEPIAVPRGAVILRLAEIQDPRLPELEEVRGRVVAGARLAKQQELGLAKLAAHRAALAAGTTTLDAVGTELGLVVRETGDFGAGTMVPGIGAAPALVASALALETGQTGAPFAGDRGAILYMVSNRTHWDALGFESRAKGLRTSLEFQEVQRALASLVAERRRELGVNYDRQLVEQFDLLGENGEPGA